MLDEVLECGERAGPDATQLKGDERLEQPPEPAAAQHDLGAAAQQRLLAFRFDRPVVSRPLYERDADTLVRKGTPLVPGEPTFPDRDAATQVAGPLGADALSERTLAAGRDNRLRPQTDFFQPRESRPDDVDRSVDADR